MDGELPKGQNNRKGVVAVLDLLGTKHEGRSGEPGHLIEVWRSLIEFTDSDVFPKDLGPAPPLLGFLAVLKGHKTMLTKQTARFSAFSDTLVLTAWTNSAPKDLLAPVGYALQQVVSRAFIIGAFVRGAVSVGNYVEYSSPELDMIVGPAATDAFEAASELDWAGIHLTPSASYAWESFLEPDLNADEDPIFPSEFVRYKAPPSRTSGSSPEPRETWVLNWPERWLETKHHRSTLLDQFSSRIIPQVAVSKYQNTLAFFDWWEERKRRSESEEMP